MSISCLSDGDIDVCENYFKNFFFKDNLIRKNILLARNFNINLLHFEQTKRAQNFINLMFEYGSITTTNKPTRTTKGSISVIDHLIRNSKKNN